mmetsp:Transcript_38197/g.61997  ORF Transcript_38197/g.61997 Transcript_38197/m.61997 type:complete len:487 (-) Transcript_38197:40-1500(-)|eukprot:CAMPEP_0203749852 /NCGR_PEP_ID=MMETSP0098-20131031/4247_1 /ASSEMBLY_ACC=CAM_ASM_000208 /TAXON_ID=96639 /ORGANISM=" , Strain NY0313808BC1" /LENGTH=486 /DNA_ID=CAMNT_0050638969 /DNA_START=124 /DNA_END=1584 /DNA_ORIENTATION=+
MALFDFAQMGKDFVKSKNKKDDKAEDDAQAEVESLTSVQTLSSCEGDKPVVPEDCCHAGLLSDSTITDDDTLSETSDGSGMWSRSKRKTKIKLSQLKQFSLRRNKSERAIEKKKTVSVPAEEADYEPITMEHSNQLTIAAHDASYGVAFKILKSMNRCDRQLILKLLFIKVSQISNDELDAYNIIFKPMFGIRARTNTTFRSVKILRQATWAHSLVKVTASLKLSTRMVISSGDWRLPTRLTASMTQKQGQQASKEECESGNSSAVLDSVEYKFFEKLQGNMEARLGYEATMQMLAWVIEAAGHENAAIFEETKEVIKRREKMRKKHEKMRKKDEKKLRKQSKSVVVEDVSRDDDVELAKLEDMFHIKQVVANIESVKPGFGKYVVLLMMTLALRAKEAEGEFQFTNKKEMVKKLALVGAKDGIIGLSLGIPLATFVNPFLGFPLMAMSFINLSAGSTELNLIEPVCMMMLHVLILASNGTNVRDF